MKALRINALEYNTMKAKKSGHIRLYGNDYIVGETIRLDVWSVHSNRPIGLSLEVEVSGIKKVSPYITDIYEFEVCVKD